MQLFGEYLEIGLFLWQMLSKQEGTLCLLGRTDMPDIIRVPGKPLPVLCTHWSLLAWFRETRTGF